MLGLDRVIDLYFRLKLNDCIKKGLKIGQDTIILCRPDFGSEPYLIRIGCHCMISGHVRFITHDGGTWVFRNDENYRHINKYGRIEIKDNCFIGMGSIIMPNVTIGPNAVVGAGAVVTGNIPPNVCAAGNPAKVICSLDEYIEKSVKRTLKFPQSFTSKREVLEKHFWSEK